MKNGVEIKNCEKGFLINNTTLIDNDNAEKVLSEYFFFDYWEGKEIDASQGELSKEALFLHAEIGNIGPFGFCAERFSYFTDIKFGAGYIKYIMLGDLAYNLLTPKEEFTDVYELVDVDETIQVAEEKGKDQYSIIPSVKHIINLCNRIFIEVDSKKQVEYLIYAANEFNTFCRKHIDFTGHYYRFNAFADHKQAKDAILECVLPYKRKLLEDVFSSQEWTEAEKKIIQSEIDDIIGG